MPLFPINPPFSPPGGISGPDLFRVHGVRRLQSKTLVTMLEQNLWSKGSDDTKIRLICRSSRFATKWRIFTKIAFEKFALLGT